MGRLIGGVLAAVLLLLSVVFGQIYLHNVLTNIAQRADAACVLLAEKKEAEGEEAIRSLVTAFEEKKKVLLLFLNDARIHELHRSALRSLRLAEIGEFSPALEALSDFAAAVRELSDTHHPTAENILKVMNLSEFRLDKPRRL